MASLGQYIYGVSEQKNEVYVNLFVSNDSDLLLSNGQKVHMKLKTRFPYENQIYLQVSEIPKEGMELYIRVPDYASEYEVKISGTPVGEKTEKGYWRVSLEQDAEVEVSFAAPAHFVYANPKVRADAGKTAIVRGPLVYCLEECDNGENLPGILVDTESTLWEESSDLFGGCVRVHGIGKKVCEDSWNGGLYGTEKPKMKDVEFTAVPYCYWNNRSVGEMLV